MPFLLACGTCGYWIAWSLFPPAVWWTLIFAGWFLGLSVIPSLKITDLGLIDVDQFEVVPLEVDV